MEVKPDQNIEEFEKRPTEPWDQWLDNFHKSTEKWFPPDNGSSTENVEVPDRFKPILFDIPKSEEEWKTLLEVNKLIRVSLGNEESGVFYRPGLGYGDALREIIEKIGSYQKLLITDPVYVSREIKIPYGEDALLPLDYFYRTLEVLEADNIRVSLKRPDGDLEEIDTSQIENAEIPPETVGVINFRLNGIPMEIQLLSEDMNTLNTGRIDILGLGRPTPTNESYDDPRHRPEFIIKEINDLNAGGIIEYSLTNFRFLPESLPPEAFGFSILHSTKMSGSQMITSRTEAGLTIIRKNEDIGERIAKMIEADQIIRQSLRCLAGEILVDKDSGWTVYMDDAGEMINESGQEVTVDDIARHFSDSLKQLHEIINTIPDQDIRNKSLKRIEFLYMGPISEAGEYSVEKVKHIQDQPIDPDTPGQKDSYTKSTTYFGNLSRLIKDHNNHKLDIFDYYRNIHHVFYSEFSELKH